MNRRRKIYRGINRRSRFNILKTITIVTVIVVIGLAGRYSYTKIKDINIEDINIVEKFNNSDIVSRITSKIPFLNNFDSNFITADDISKELVELQGDTENDDSIESSNMEKVEGTKLAKTEGWSFYTIQVASVQNGKDLEKIESELDNNKIPFSVVDINGIKKVQTYSFFEQDATRAYLEEVKEVYPDAFLAEMKIPMLSLEYTSKYEYVGGISNQLNKLITNFKDESDFWKKNKDNINKQEYNKILTNRSEIIQSIEEEVNKIDYDGMSSFKSNLVKYTNDVNEKITQSSKAANEEQYHISKSNFISCMQGYFSFIKLIEV